MFSELQPLKLPVAMPMWIVGYLAMSADEVRQAFGPAHYVGKSTSWHGDDFEEAWAFQLSSGQRVLILHEFGTNHPKSNVEVHCDPPDFVPFLHLIGFSSTPDRFKYEEQPIPLHDPTFRNWTPEKARANREAAEKRDAK